MKFGVLFTLMIGIIFVAYINATSQLSKNVDLKALRLQMTVAELTESFGSPHSRERNTLIYILPDASRLSITLRDDVIASAVVKYHKPLRIEDPQMRQLTLVQMSRDFEAEDPSWFFASKPEEGLIYKITQQGEIESLTWVPPFTYLHHQEKNLQVLLKDFKTQNTSQL